MFLHLQSLRREECLCDLKEVSSLEEMLLNFWNCWLVKAVNTWVSSAFGNVLNKYFPPRSNNHQCVCVCLYKCNGWTSGCRSAILTITLPGTARWVGEFHTNSPIIIIIIIIIMLLYSICSPRHLASWEISHKLNPSSFTSFACFLRQRQCFMDNLLFLKQTIIR